MGAGGSKPEDIAKLAQDDGNYKPPLGAPNPVSCRACAWAVCGRRVAVPWLGRARRHLDALPCLQVALMPLATAGEPHCVV